MMMNVYLLQEKADMHMFYESAMATVRRPQAQGGHFKHLL
jgi:hypothetical protein